MRKRVSDTAEYGDMTRGKVIVDQRTRKKMKKILKDIQSGKFAREWIKENEEGRKNLDEMRKKEAAHPIEEVGKELRAMMPWMKE